MFQLSLCVSGLNEDYIDKSKKDLKNKIISLDGVFSLYEKGDFTYFLIVSNKNTEKIINLVKSFIFDAIINCFKLKLIVENLKYDFEKDIKYHALIQALLSFDSACDEEYLLSKIDLSSNEFYIESFYYFKCRLMREKWLQLIEITNQNSKLLNVEDNYLDVIRFLIEGIDKKQDIIIEAKEKSFQVCTNEKVFLLESYKSLMDFIIKNNPKKICVKNVDKKFVNFLKQLFSSRVIVC